LTIAILQETKVMGDKLTQIASHYGKDETLLLWKKKEVLGVWLYDGTLVR